MDRVADVIGQRRGALEVVEVVLQLADEVVVAFMPCLRSLKSRVGLEGRAQVFQGVVQSGAHRADGRPHGLGGLRRGEADVVDQHDDRPVLDAEAPERLIELLLRRRRARPCPVHRLVGCQQPQVAAMTSFAAGLG